MESNGEKWKGIDGGGKREKERKRNSAVFSDIFILNNDETDGALLHHRITWFVQLNRVIPLFSLFFRFFPIPLHLWATPKIVSRLNLQMGRNWKDTLMRCQSITLIIQANKIRATDESLKILGPRRAGAPSPRRSFSHFSIHFLANFNQSIPSFEKRTLLKKFHFISRRLSWLDYN